MLPSRARRRPAARVDYGWGMRIGIAVVALAGVAAGASVAGCGRKEVEEAEEAPPAHVRCAAAAAATLADTTLLRGEIEPPPRAEQVVAAPVGGRIARIAVDEGDVVAAGAEIAVIEDPGLGAAANESGAELAAAEAELKAATIERERQAKLVAAGIGPQGDLDDAIGREASARGARDAALSRRTLARSQTARAVLRAARAATVLHVFRRAGELIDVSDPGSAAIAELADLSVLELRAQVTGRDLVGLAAGDAAEVTLDALPGVTLHGTIAAVSPAIDPATSLGTVRVRLDLGGGPRPAVGLPGVAVVRRAPRTAVTV
ncbi:MAG TPA: efflux RND transporter periplasmic adaptor subunit, partial [Kofleriaceae bacterium]|nr:efflux RND transporter periplasmic adaptor subunit [Kofleriaceae bacterium]